MFTEIMAQDKLVFRRDVLVGAWGMIRTLPRQTTNPNVPRGVLVLAETVTANREITTTWYVDRAGGLWKVGDWCTDRPEPAFLSEVCRLTLLTEGLLRGIWQSWVQSV